MISNEAKRVLGFLRSSSAAEKSLEEARENAKNMRSVVKFPEGIEKVRIPRTLFCAVSPSAAEE